MNARIEEARKANKSFFLPANGETCFRTMDGSDVAAWLTKEGYKVKKNWDTGRNGLAVTECGVSVSTNGNVTFGREF